MSSCTRLKRKLSGTRKKENGNFRHSSLNKKKFNFPNLETQSNSFRRNSKTRKFNLQLLNIVIMKPINHIRTNKTSANKEKPMVSKIVETVKKEHI